MRTNATKNEIASAIAAVNEKHGYKIIIKDLNYSTQKTIQFTIRSERSGIPGSCYAQSGRKSIAASWHAHGYLFDELFKIRNDIYIIAAGRRITAEMGNWVDFNVGSQASPTKASELSIL